MKRALCVGDWVRTDWALGSKDGRTHYGVLLQIGPGAKFGKVDWNTPGLPRYVPLATLEFVLDSHVASLFGSQLLHPQDTRAPGQARCGEGLLPDSGDHAEIAMDGFTLVGQRVRARRTVEQSPLDPAPAVPTRTVGHVEDFDDLAELYAVDFGDPYGVVLCARDEVAP